MSTIHAIVPYCGELQPNVLRLLNVQIGFYDDYAVIDAPQIEVYYGDIASLRELTDRIEAGVMQYAIDHEYDMTKDDIWWVGINFLPPATEKSLAGITSSAVNGKSVGNTVMYTNTEPTNFIVTDIILMPVTISGIGTPPVINVGKNGSSFNDILSAASMGILTTVGGYTRLSPIAGASIVAPGESISVRVATAALLYSTYSFKIIIKGIYM